MGGAANDSPTEPIGVFTATHEKHRKKILWQIQTVTLRRGMISTRFFPFQNFKKLYFISMHYCQGSH